MKAITFIAVLALFFSCYYATRTILATENYYFKTDNWSLVGVANENELVTVHLFLYQRNLERLNTEFERRSDPNSRLWRKWLSNEQIQRIVSPPASEVKVVTSWVSEYEVVKMQNLGDCIIIEASVATINDMFQTTLHTFSHKESGILVHRHLKEYSLPEEVATLVQFVTGINGFPYVAKSQIRKHNQFDDETYKVVPYVIDQLYNIDYTLKGEINQDSSVGVAEFQDYRSFKASDLTYFQSQNLIPENAVTEIVGPYSDSLAALESTLDIQYAGGVSYNTSTWYYTVKGWMLEFAALINSANNYSNVISMSWGWTENDQCDITTCKSSEEYVSRVNTEFQKIGLKGITLIASSGDQGAPGDGNPDCFDKEQPLSAIFPGASPYVLSVGATMLTTPVLSKRNDQPAPPVCTTETCADVSTSTEVACSYPDALITSGGGFSVYSPRPSWQNTVVSNYLSTATGLPPTQYFNSSNRGFPDVSALGHNYLIYIEGVWEIVDGTSCSAPVWGALVSLLNQNEIKNGRPTLGFINNLIYNAYASNPDIFNDITSGNNDCTESACCTYGYPTASGWDAVTGLGSPNFGLLLSYVQSLSN